LSTKIVIDTNIYISAIFWGGKPRQVVDLVRSGRVDIFTSSAIKNEIAGKLIEKFKLNEEEIENVLIDFSAFTIPVEVSMKVSR